MTTKTKHIVVLGSVNQDHVILTEYLPKIGQTIVGNGYFSARGGKGANQAVAISRLGGAPSFIACVGEDAFANEVIADYQEAGIDTRYMHKFAGQSTGVALITVDKEGHNMICIAPNANDLLTTEHVKKHTEVLQKADFLLMQLETPMAGVELAAKEAHGAGAYVILNPAPAKALPDSIYPYIDLMTPNETEVELLTGIKVVDKDSAEKAASILLDKGVTNVIITLGARGAYLRPHDQAGEIIAGFKVDAKDTTAAGDTFNGALVVALSEGKSMKEAVLFAHRASAISVTRLGAQSSIPSRDEVLNFA